MPRIDVMMLGHFAVDRQAVDGVGHVSSGCGDTCFSTYLSCRLSALPQEAARLAAAVTSLKQEVPGQWRGSLADDLKLASFAT